MIALLVVVGALTGCVDLYFPFGMGEPTGGPPTPGSFPEFPVVIGARVDGGDLIVSTGRNCPAKTVIDIGTVMHSGVVYVTALVALNRINVSNPGSDVSVEQHIFDLQSWLDDKLAAGVILPDGRATWAADPELDLTGLLQSSRQHPEDEYYFGSFGWLTAEQVQARDGVDLLTICTPR